MGAPFMSLDRITVAVFHFGRNLKGEEKRLRGGVPEFVWNRPHLFSHQLLIDRGNLPAKKIQVYYELVGIYDSCNGDGV